MTNAVSPRSSGLLFESRNQAKPRAECRTEPDRPTCAAWDQYVLGHQAGTIFHTQAWRIAVAKTFGHAHVYLSAQRGGRLRGVLPMFLVNSRFLGRLLVSVPYGVGGGILADDEEAVAALFNSAIQVAEDRRCVGIDLRSEFPVIADLPTRDGYVGFVRDLPDRVDDVLISLPRKARAAARNARRKHGLRISYGDHLLPEVWKLYTRSMRRLGSLNYPYPFFENLADATPGRHWVSLVFHDGRPVAGLMTLLFGGTVMPYFIGTSTRARTCSAANFIYLCTMERAVARGFDRFDFGRSRRANTGSYDFKRFQGFTPRPLGYQYYAVDARTQVDFSPEQSRYAIARRIWPKLPLKLTRALGARLSYHFPG